MEQHQNVAVAVGAAAFTVGAPTGLTLIGLAIADARNESSPWFRPLAYVSIVLVLVGLYLLVAVPYLGAPSPPIRSSPIWRSLWPRLPFSRQSRAWRAHARYRKADNKLYDRIRAEVERYGFTAHRAVQTVHEAATAPVDWRQYWVAPIGTSKLHMLGFGASGNVTDVEGSTIDAPDVVERIRQFDELKTAAREWPETKEREKLLARYESLVANNL